LSLENPCSTRNKCRLIGSPSQGNDGAYYPSLAGLCHLNAHFYAIPFIRLQPVLTRYIWEQRLQNGIKSCRFNYIRYNDLTLTLGLHNNVV